MTKSELQQKMDAFQEWKREITPDPAWLCRERETLLMQVRNSMPVRDGFLRRCKTILRNFFPETWHGVFRGPAFALFSLLGIISGGSFMSVSAAERSLPGDFLFPVKLVSEQTRLLFANGKAEKIKLKAEFVGRRADEIHEIATTDVTKKQERLHEATEILRRDLDTVNSQLTEAVGQNSKSEVAMAAHVVDQASTSLAKTLKGVKIILPDDEKDGLNQAEAAAVNTGVRAVQVLIESQDQMEEKDIVVSSDQLKESVQDKVQGMEDHIASAALKLVASSSTASEATNAATSTRSMTTEAVSSTNQQIRTAQQSLTETRQLLEENKMQEVKDRLGEASRVVTSVEKTMVAMPSASTSTVAVPTTDATTESNSSKNQAETAPITNSQPH